MQCPIVLVLLALVLLIYTNFLKSIMYQKVLFCGWFCWKHSKVGAKCGCWNGAWTSFSPKEVKFTTRIHYPRSFCGKYIGLTLAVGETPQYIDVGFLKMKTMRQRLQKRFLNQIRYSALPYLLGLCSENVLVWTFVFFLFLLECYVFVSPTVIKLQWIWTNNIR